jgi:hypothetical protein
MVAVPALTPFTVAVAPFVPPPVTVATLVFELVHVTALLSVVFDGVTVAVRLNELPLTIVFEVLLRPIPVIGTLGF